MFYSPEFSNFMNNFRDLYLKIVSEKPYYVLFTGDFNAHSIRWWPNGDSNNEGTQLNILFSELGLRWSYSIKGQNENLFYN